MNRKDLVSAVATASGLSKAEAGKAVDGMLEAIAVALESGEIVKLAGLGSIAGVARSARVGHNPRTGEPMQVGPRITIRFKASPSILARLNQVADYGFAPEASAVEAEWEETGDLDGDSDDDGSGGPRIGA